MRERECKGNKPNISTLGTQKLTRVGVYITRGNKK